MFQQIVLQKSSRSPQNHLHLKKAYEREAATSAKLRSMIDETEVCTMEGFLKSPRMIKKFETIKRSRSQNNDSSPLPMICERQVNLNESLSHYQNETITKKVDGVIQRNIVKVYDQLKQLRLFSVKFQTPLIIGRQDMEEENLKQDRVKNMKLKNYLRTGNDHNNSSIKTMKKLVMRFKQADLNQQVKLIKYIEQIQYEQDNVIEDKSEDTKQYSNRIIKIQNQFPRSNTITSESSRSNQILPKINNRRALIV